MVIRQHFGLSLCIQGTLCNQLDREALIRFIPVYTGNTLNAVDMHQLHTVYPCVYREHTNPIKLTKNILGLSLCIQGTPQL